MHDAVLPSPALLPAGLADLLPPAAEAEARAVEAMLDVFATYAYQRVKPPMLEFEDTLLAGAGQAVADQTFRVMDPASRRMMGLRADITPQIARLAATRLAAAPRPLRLSYAGQCLRVAGQQIAPDRQISQVGIELIGIDSVRADAELVCVAAEALASIGLRRISIDLTMPRLLQAVLQDANLPPARAAHLARALDRKDAAAVKADAGLLSDTLHALLRAAGRPDHALPALAAIPLAGPAADHAARLADTVRAIAGRAPDLTLTVDPVEARGFRYHTGVCMTVFAPGRHEELGRGGRYVAGGVDFPAEPASGVTLYADAILRAVPPAPLRPRVFVPLDAGQTAAAALRDQGHATVLALEPAPNPAAEAIRLRCRYWLDGETLREPER